MEAVKVRLMEPVGAPLSVTVTVITAVLPAAGLAFKVREPVGFAFVYDT